MDTIVQSEKDPSSRLPAPRPLTQKPRSFYIQGRPVSKPPPYLQRSSRLSKRLAPKEPIFRSADFRAAVRSYHRENGVGMAEFEGR